MSTASLAAVAAAAGGMRPRERLLRALAGKEVDRVPVWFMRQAGRYLPEYRALREGLPFERRMADPTVAAEVTLQPLRRFPLDAAILFSDILAPLPAMGHAVRFEAGGPVVEDPVRTPAQAEGLRALRPERDLAFVGQALGQVRAALPDHAVLGFAGAPFTLASYLVEGRGSRDFAATKAFAYGHPEAWRLLTGKLADAVADHLAFQARAGADAVQLFDSWADILSPRDYAALALPGVQRAVRRFREQAAAPLLFFARGSSHLLPLLGRTGADAYSVDWRVDLSDVRRLHPGKALQGNLDPTLLLAPVGTVRAETARTLEQLGGDGHVFNLGHGILPQTPIEAVQAMVETVVAWRP
ncbi:MAG TPA: uroporphyrinogen decarboxylase [Candidatus Thermoplasmatota archaeon]|nr:uroporphyrinogen decarboxylase [Candidatus Thermoplasmatota archaeon]